MECWRPETLLDIAAKADRPMDADEFTDRHKKIRFNRIWVAIDSLEPLRPEISIHGSDGLFGNLPSTRMCRWFATAAADWDILTMIVGFCCLL